MAGFVARAFLGIASYAGLVYSTLPPQCNANFRWDDCGQPPQLVVYYWKVGSRCEVGTWRGCLPNMNMFKDEYECVSTCTFAVRAGAQDFHGLNKEGTYLTENLTNFEDNYVDTTTSDNVNATTPTNDTIDDNEGGPKNETTNENADEDKKDDDKNDDGTDNKDDNTVKNDDNVAGGENKPSSGNSTADADTPAKPEDGEGDGTAAPEENEANPDAEPEEA